MEWKDKRGNKYKEHRRNVIYGETNNIDISSSKNVESNGRDNRSE